MEEDLVVEKVDYLLGFTFQSQVNVQDLLPLIQSARTPHKVVVKAVQNYHHGLKVQFQNQVHVPDLLA